MVALIGLAPCSAQRITDRSDIPSVGRIVTANGSGTAFLVRSDGCVATAFHVVCDASAAWVHFPGGRVCPVVGLWAAMPKRDMAIVKLDMSAFGAAPPEPLEIGPIPAPGDPIVVIGHPGTGSQRKGSGIVYRSGRRGSEHRVLQMSLEVGPGCSGGPALDSRGRACGVVSGGYGPRSQLSVASCFVGPSDLPAPGTPARPLGEAALEHAGTPEGLIGRAFAVLAFWRDRSANGADSRAAAAWALRQLREVTAAWPECADAQVARAMCARGLGATREAVQAVRMAIRAEPDNLMAYCVISSLHARARRHGAAEWAARQAIRLAARFHLAHLCLGYALGERRLHRRAACALTEAARLNPRDIETHLALGAALARMKRYRAALDAFRAALGVKLRCARAHYGVGICCLFIGDRSQAKRELALLERLDRALAFKLRYYLRKHPAAPSHRGEGTWP